MTEIFISEHGILATLLERIAVALEKMALPCVIVGAPSPAPPVCSGSERRVCYKPGTTVAHCGVCGVEVTPDPGDVLAPTHAYRPKDGA